MVDTLPNQRLRIVREALGLNLREFSAPLNRSHVAVFDWEKGKAPIQPVTADSIEKHHGISAQWLLTGEGDMFVNPSTVPSIRHIPVLTAHPCAGHGNQLDDYVGSEGAMSFNERWLRSCFGIHLQNLCLMMISGDSMVPTIAPDEMVFIDGLHGLPDYRDGVWVLRLGDKLLVKRVQLLAPNEYRVTSDNPAYQAIQLDDPAMLLGRVVGGIRRY
jgi:hypothetical protein